VTKDDKDYDDDYDDDDNNNNNNNFKLKVSVKGITFLIHIPEIPSSNLGLNFGYSD